MKKINSPKTNAKKSGRIEVNSKKTRRKMDALEKKKDYRISNFDG